MCHGIQSAVAYLGLRHGAIDAAVLEKLLKVRPAAVCHQPQPQFAVDENLSPCRVVDCGEAILSGLLQAVSVRGAGSVRVGDEVTEIAVNHPAQPDGRDHWTGRVSNQPPGFPEPVEARGELAYRERIRRQLSGIKARTPYAANRLQQIELPGPEHCADHRKGTSICRIWKAADFGLPEVPSKDAVGGTGVQDGVWKVTDGLGRPVEIVGHRGPVGPTALSAD